MDCNNTQGGQGPAQNRVGNGSSHHSHGRGRACAKPTGGRGAQGIRIGLGPRGPTGSAGHVAKYRPVTTPAEKNLVFQLLPTCSFSNVPDFHAMERAWKQHVNQPDIPKDKKIFPKNAESLQEYCLKIRQNSRYKDSLNRKSKESSQGSPLLSSASGSHEQGMAGNAGIPSPLATTATQTVSAAWFLPMFVNNPLGYGYTLQPSGRPVPVQHGASVSTPAPQAPGAVTAPPVQLQPAAPRPPQPAQGARPPRSADNPIGQRLGRTRRGAPGVPRSCSTCSQAAGKKVMQKDVAGHLRLCRHHPANKQCLYCSTRRRPVMQAADEGHKPDCQFFKG